MSIRRNIEINFLQNRKYTDSNCPKSNDKTVFISSLDLIGEIAVLTNPTNDNVSIEKWSISDGKKLHTFVFPLNCVIHRNSTLNVYTCPGREYNGGVYTNPCVLWTNLDGTMRKKEVLNNGANVFHQNLLAAYVPYLQIIAPCSFTTLLESSSHRVLPPNTTLVAR